MKEQQQQQKSVEKKFKTIRRFKTDEPSRSLDFKPTFWKHWTVGEGNSRLYYFQYDRQPTPFCFSRRGTLSSISPPRCDDNSYSYLVLYMKTKDTFEIVCYAISFIPHIKDIAKYTTIIQEIK